MKRVGQDTEKSSPVKTGQRYSGYRDTEDTQETQDTHDTEKRRDRETQDTHETQDSARRGRVFTIQQAVNVSLEDGVVSGSIFKFCRTLKAFEKSTGKSVRLELESVFSTWWAKAKPYLMETASFEHSLDQFCETYEKTRVPLGKNSVDEAISLAETTPMPEPARAFSSEAYQKLVSVCFHLQQLSGENPFFLSVRDAMRISRETSRWAASTMLHGLVRRGVLSVIEQGTKDGRRATRYRFNFQKP